MFKIGLSGFRVFDETPDIQISPITFITGGNSAGKTSFLSALNLLSDLSDFRSNASFNKEPFFLGSFDQISHYRAGRYGRSKYVKFRIKGNPRLNADHIPGVNTDILPDRASIELSYANRFGQATLSSFIYFSDNFSVVFSFNDDWSVLTVNYKDSSESYDFSTSASDLPSIEIFGLNGFLIAAVVDRILHGYGRLSEFKTEPTRRMLLVGSELQAAFRMIPPTGFVGGPVRSSPQRTYNPTAPVTQSEGAHVPSQMAQLARTHPSQWSKIKEEMSQFGRESGLFEEVQVRRLGRGDSDPFQLNVKIEGNGPRRNILDVGYGVSQALPIVFELSTRRENSLYMIQQPEVHLHPEAQSALGSYIVSSINQKPGFIIVETHSDFIIDRVRRHIRDKKIDRSSVSLLYFERKDYATAIHKITIGDNGEVLNTPPSYREFFVRESIRNISL